jgi:hypothetical protein
MGFLDRIFGTEKPAVSPRDRIAPASSPDEQALQRYRYMLQTAPPETVEQAHREAFDKLTPEQRRMVLQQLTEAAPANERAALAATPVDDTGALARAATRAEVRQPGTMERSLASPGMGLGASLLSSFAMGFVGSMVAQSFLSAIGGFGDSSGNEAAAEDANADEPAAEDDTQLADYGGDDGGGDFGGGDFDV